MAIERGWTMKRLENVIRVRLYEERFHYEGEWEMLAQIF